MFAADFDTFRGILEQCALTFGKGKPDDALVQSYWKALKDLQISTVAHRAEMHARYEKFFPKPFELRPKDEKPPTDKRDDGALKEGQHRADERLEWLRKSDPAEWLKQVSPKVYEMGRTRGMLDGMIAQKLQDSLAKP
jgi:hypothetical protein